MRAHQAVRVHLPAKLVGHHREQVEEVDPVDVGAEDRSVADAVRRHMEDPVRKTASQDSRHLASTVARPERRTQPLRSFCHTVGTEQRQTRANVEPGRGLTPNWPGSDPGLCLSGRVAGRAGAGLG